MQIWLDSINLELIRENAHLISGVTTNPSILSTSNDIPETLNRLLEIQPGIVAVQVTDSILEEARCLHAYSNRIIIKIPIQNPGLKAIAELKREGLSIMGTAILNPAQALLAANLKVDFIAPYFSHMNTPRETLLSIVAIAKHSSTKVLVASVKSIDDLIFCAEIGVDAVTIKDNLFFNLIADHPSLEPIMAKFQLDWGKQKRLTSLLSGTIASQFC